jgi:hypothetical protein
MLAETQATAVRLSPERPAFHPFYWRIVSTSRRPVLAQLRFAVVLGLAFLVPHLVTTGKAMFDDLSWMVGVMIASAMLLLFYATSTLLGVIAEADTRVSSQSRHSYLDPLQFSLSDGKFIFAGIFFGALNCVMGHAFGVHYAAVSSKVTIFFGFFLVGFVAGMAAYGLAGVFGFMHGFVQAQPALDYRDPDRCAGTSFLGQALVKFSVLNLVMGVMISVYIVFAPWTHRSQVLVRILMWAWIAFPFIVSFAHLLGPGSVVHVLLQRYKKKMYAVIAAEVRSTREKLNADHGDTRALREELEYNLKLQNEIYRLRTWPFSLASTAHFAIAFCVDAIPAFAEIAKLFTEATSRKP